MKLSNLTNKNLITLDLEAKTKVEVIKKLVEKLDGEGVLASKDEFLKAVLDREELSPTGLEEGLAIPHVLLFSILYFLHFFRNKSFDISK